MSGTTVMLRFQPTRATWMCVAAAATMLAVGVLFAVALGVDWASTTAEGTEVGYGLREVSIGPFSGDYDDLDRPEGTGMIAAAHGIGIAATVVAFLAMLVLAAASVAPSWLRSSGAVAAGAAALLLIAAIVLGALGIDAAHADTFGAGGAGLRWRAGFILGVLAAVLGVLATVLGAASRAGRD